MAKAKRYDEGGVTEGQNKGIDDDTRARAMKFVQEQSEKADSEEPEVKAKTVTKVTKAKSEPKAKSETKSEPKTESKSVKMTREESLAAIPTGGKKGAGPTAGNGNSVDSTELSRNASALMNFSGPGKLATGLSLAAREGMAARTAAKAAEAAAETAKATRAARVTKTAPRAAREAKTLNPNAWMAGPKGMKDDFKKGGSVKGWGISRGARAAKVY
jgi:hypothetical protein